MTQPSSDCVNYGYIPSGSTIELVLESLNDYLSVELALPGNWSPQIFYFDVKTFPAKSKLVLSEILSEYLIQSEPDYLKYFQQTRGYPRPSSGHLEKPVWTAFTRGSVMLYFESLFLAMLHEIQTNGQLNPIYSVLLQYIDALSKSPLQEWDHLVANIGACNHLYFAQDPLSYAQLIFSDRSNQTKRPQDMTDFEMLTEMSTQLSPVKYPNQVYLHGDRNQLIQLYLSRTNHTTR